MVIIYMYIGIHFDSLNWTSSLQHVALFLIKFFYGSPLMVARLLQEQKDIK